MTPFHSKQGYEGKNFWDVLGASHESEGTLDKCSKLLWRDCPILFWNDSLKVKFRMKKFRTKSFRTFFHRISDGFAEVWDN